MAQKFTSAMVAYLDTGRRPIVRRTRRAFPSPAWDFSKELKALTPEDKLEFADGLRKLGVDCENPSV